MSICVTVRTKKKIEPEEIFKTLADRGEQIIVTSADFPVLHFGTHMKAIRGIELNEVEDGYEVRVCAFSSKEDYQLFRNTINVLTEITGSKAYLDNDDDDQIDDPIARFNDEWIEETMQNDVKLHTILSSAYGSPVVIDGLFMKLCIGPKMFHDFDIPLKGEHKKENAEELYEYLCSAQWHFANLKDTSTRLMLNDPADSSKEPLSVSYIYIKNGEVGKFDYISEADLLAIMDMDNEDNAPVLIPFYKIGRILPGGIFRPIDEWQYERCEELTVDMVYEMMERG